MKKTMLVACATLAGAGILLADLFIPFQSWDQTKNHERDVVIARCTQTPAPEPIRHTSLVTANGEIISVLKGNCKPGSVQIQFWDDHWPSQNQYYLIFGLYSEHALSAAGNYSVIPLGYSFSTNLLAGKTFDEQIQFMLQRRLDALNRQMVNELKEKRILEEGVKKK